MSRESRLDVRANAHRAQCYHYQRLIKILKPEWYTETKVGLAFADTEECPLNAIHNIWDRADESWENEEDYLKSIDDASERCSKDLDEFEEKYKETEA